MIDPKYTGRFIMDDDTKSGHVINCLHATTETRKSETRPKTATNDTKSPTVVINTYGDENRSGVARKNLESQILGREERSAGGDKGKTENDELNSEENRYELGGTKKRLFLDARVNLSVFALILIVIYLFYYNSDYID